MIFFEPQAKNCELFGLGLVHVFFLGNPCRTLASGQPLQSQYKFQDFRSINLFVNAVTRMIG